MSSIRIELQDIGKRYRKEWIFRHIDFSFQSGQHYAILGPNGSGKSTLLKILSGSLNPSAGVISYHLDQQTFNQENIFRHLSWAAPYIELIEEYSLEEIIAFQAGFVPFRDQLSASNIIDLVQLPGGRTKQQIRFYSSGMKQRVKLALALLADTPIVLLDEPTTNLDEEAIGWYQQLIERFGAERLILVASNQQVEYAFCTAFFNIREFK